MYHDVRRDESQTVQAVYSRASGWTSWTQPTISSTITREERNCRWRIVHEWTSLNHDIAATPTFDELDHFLELLPGFELALSIEHARRTFFNSDKLTFERHWKWYDLNGRRAPGGRISLGGGSVRELLSRCDQNTFSTYCGLTSSADSTEDLLLEPLVAAVMFHEWLGHGIEEGIVKGYLGHPSLTVWAYLPTGATWDDDGVQPPLRPLIKAGWVQEHLIGCRLSQEGRLGFAQAALHHAATAVRLTHLSIEGGSNDILVSDTVVRCINVSKAELVGPVMYIHIDHAVKGGIFMSPFTAVVPLAAMPKKFLQLGSARSTHAARCIKNGASLPSIITSPAVLLSNIMCLSV